MKKSKFTEEQIAFALHHSNFPPIPTPQEVAQRLTLQ